MQERIKELEALILKHKDLYYNDPENEDCVSDAEFDSWEDTLRALDPENLVLKLVGATPQPNGPKITHTIPFLSQEKCLTKEDALKWINKQEYKDIYTLSWKLDGGALELRYLNKVLIEAVTRGKDGIGTDCTAACLAISSIPSTIALDGDVKVRGEVVLKKTMLESINMKRVKLGEKPFSNCRNLASGTLRIEDLKEVAARKLDYLAYDLFLDNEFLGGVKYSERMTKLAELGFDTPTWVMITGDTSIMAEYDKFEASRDSYPFDTDGLMVRMDDMGFCNELGWTEHHPKYSMAMKWSREETPVTINNIDWTYSRTGTYTPTVEYPSTLISGGMLSRAKAHNLSYLKLHNLAVGTKIGVVRSGEVIPWIASSQGNINPDAWKEAIPKVCPVTGRPMRIVKTSEDGAVILKVTDPDTHPIVIARRWEHFLKECKSKGWGEETLEEFAINSGWITIEQFLATTADDIQKYITSRTIGDDFANKLVKALEVITDDELPLAYFLKGLGLHRASSTARRAANIIATPDQIFTEDVWVKSGITEGIIESLMDDLDKRQHEIMRLISMLDIKFSDNSGTSVLAGKKICITGTLTKSRDLYVDMIEKNGGRFVNSVSGNTDMLMVGAKAGSKKEKAMNKGIKIISEEDFQKLLNM